MHYRDDNLSLVGRTEKFWKSARKTGNCHKPRFRSIGMLFQKCKCKKHSSGCGCLSDAFIAKAHTNFTSILIAAQSREKYAKCMKALASHAVDDHSLPQHIQLR